MRGPAKAEPQRCAVLNCEIPERNGPFRATFCKWWLLAIPHGVGHGISRYDAIQSPSQPSSHALARLAHCFVGGMAPHLAMNSQFWRSRGRRNQCCGNSGRCNARRLECMGARRDNLPAIAQRSQSVHIRIGMDQSPARHLGVHSTLGPAICGDSRGILEPLDRWSRDRHPWTIEYVIYEP